ncbi:DUF3244 domain-containing protein [Cyclobacterium xiamenense]|uniref:DUF3244 domain-containing protein n=1 Tax=Cyclobacterium xiamenense TaxID=1297121 RepID=UPI0035CFA098
MKTLLSLLLSGTLSFASLASPTVEMLKENTRIETNGQLVQVYFKSAIDDVVLRLTDDSGRTLFKNSYTTEEPVVIPINLSQVAEGNYVLHIIGDDGSNQYELENRKKASLPLMAYGKKIGYNTLSLLVVGLEKPGTTVKFYDASNRLVLSETIDQPNGFRKNYVFEQLPVDDLSLKVIDAQGREKYIRFVD